MIYNFFNKKIGRKRNRSQCYTNQKLAAEFYELLITKFQKRKLYSSFIHNVLESQVYWYGLLSRYNKGVIDVYSKYGWVILLKDTNCITITKALQTIPKISNGKSNNYVYRTLLILWQINEIIVTRKRYWKFINK